MKHNIFKRIGALAMTAVMAFSFAVGASAASEADAIIDTSKKTSLTLFKYDMTSAEVDGAWSTESYVSTGIQDDAVNTALSPYAVKGVEFTYVRLADVSIFKENIGTDHTIMPTYGFREDVVTFIAKAPGLPNSHPWIPAINGLKFFSNQPKVHDYLAEFKRDVLAHYDCFVVGESPSTTADAALRYITEGPDQVLDEMIAFSHMEADCVLTDMIPRPFSLRKLKRAMSDWQLKLEGKAWNALYIENHDHARIISRYGSEKYRVESGKMLAAMYMLQRGTPFIYQGQEIGMLNMPLPRIEMYPDVSTQNAARIASQLLPHSQVLKLVQRGARDNARSPMQWSAEKNAGVSEATPWFCVNENYREINVAQQEEDPDSLLNFYRKLIKFRKDHPVALYGDYREYLPKDKKLYVYERSYEGKKLLVICSFTADQVRFDAPEGIELDKGLLVLENYDMNFVIANGFTTRPYELRVYLFD